MPSTTRRPLRRATALAVVAVVAACQSEQAGPADRSDGDATAVEANDPARDPARIGSPAAPVDRPRSSRGDDVRRQGEPPATIATTESLVVGGKERSFVLAVPVEYSNDEAYPLVLVLHGDSGDGPSIRAALPFDSVSGGEAIVAYPSGFYGWNLYDPAGANEDLAFLLALVDELVGRYSIDPARIFGVGFSSGAFMVNQIACRRPSLFRAIAPHSGGAPSEPRDPAATRWSNDYTRCAGQSLGEGPAVMVIHGTADGDVTFDSGDFTAMYWAYVDGCQSTRSSGFSPPPCVAHDACPAGKPVVLCAIPGLGHTLWGSAATAAWDFFRGL